MRKSLFLLVAMLLSLTAFAQREGDKITINLKGKNPVEYSLSGKNNVMSSLKYTEDKMEVYLKGLEDFGAWETFNINDIQSVAFSVYKEGDYSDVKLADQYATDATKRLFKYLKTCYGKKTISAIMAEVNWNHNEADKVYASTGKYPAFNCYDFIHICIPDNNGWINYNNITPVTEWSSAGGLVQLMWHFNVPTSEGSVIPASGGNCTCSPDKTTFKASNALVSGTWENKYFYEQMDKVVAVLSKLQEAGVAAVWRPFHEAAGNATHKSGAAWCKSWFWWGYDGPETYKKLWKTMFDYFQQKGVHNLIWTWTTQNYNGDASQYNNDADWYPGDEYVDIVGRDLYGSTAAQNKQEYDEISARYTNKIITLAECGHSDAGNFAKISDVIKAGAKWSYFMPWYGSNMPAADWWKDALSCPDVITRDQVNLDITYIEEKAIDAVANMGLGFNMGNTLDAWASGIQNNLSNVKIYETCWGQPQITEDQIKFLKAGGFNSVRLPVTWFQHMDAEGNVDKVWMDRVQECVDYIINNDMYCILNVHHDTGDGDVKYQWIKADTDNYNKNKDRFAKLWEQIAIRFSDYDSKLVFEGYNEMLDGNTWNEPKTSAGYTAINNYAQTFVNTVRATGGNNATRNLIVTTYSAAHSQKTLSSLTLPKDNVENHLIVEVHSYDPWDWFSRYGTWNSTCSNELKNMFNLLNTNFVSKGIPCIIGEYGTHGNSQVSGSSSDAQKKAAADHAADMVKQAKAYGISTFYWMSIFDASDRTNLKWTLPTVVEAMKKAYIE